MVLSFLAMSFLVSSCGGPVISSVNETKSSSNPSSNSSIPVTSTASQTPSSSPLSSSEVKKTIRTEAVVDGVNALKAVESLGYQQPVWGVDLASRYLDKSIDDFSPKLIMDTAGHLGTSLTYSYDESHAWHCDMSYGAIGTTVVPTAYLDNIIFDDSATSSSASIDQATTDTYSIQWADGHTIASSGSTVVAGSAIDMSQQIAGVLVNKTTLRTDWTLAPKNAAYASASGQSFTMLKAANKVQINLCLDGAVLNGIYFTVSAISQEVQAMNDSIATKPFGQNYTAELINAATNEVVVKTTHNPHYYLIEDHLKNEAKGVLESGSAVAFALDGTIVTPAAYRAYPLKENLCGVVCPFDINPGCISDFLNNTSSLTVPYIIKAALSDLIASLPGDLLGVNLAEYVPLAEACNFIGVNFDGTTGVFTLSLLAKTSNTSGTVSYADSGYVIRLSERGESQASALEQYLASSPTFSFLDVPQDLVTNFSRLFSSKNYTIDSQSYWTENGVVMSKGADLLALENSTLLKTSKGHSYIDPNQYFAEDKTRRAYRGCVSVNSHLYSITGVPDYTTGGVLWGKKDITSYQEEGQDKTSVALWENPNVAPYFTLASCTGDALSSLNIHTLETFES